MPLRGQIARRVDLPDFADKAFGEVQVSAGAGYDAVRAGIFRQDIILNGVGLDVRQRDFSDPIIEQFAEPDISVGADSDRVDMIAVLGPEIRSAACRPSRFLRWHLCFR